MKRWRKRVLWTFALGLLALIGVGVLLLHWAGQNPEGYRSKVYSAEVLKKLQQQAEDKLKLTASWAQGSASWPVVANRPKVETDPVAPPPAIQKIELNEDEMNALAAAWEAELLRRYGQYISDPAIGLRDGHIILFVKLKDADRVLSVHVNPIIDDKGLLTLAIDHLQVGRFTIPRPLWSSYTDKLVQLVSPNIENYRKTAKLDANGVGNEPAKMSGMARLLVQSIQGKPSDSVLFLPPNMLSDTKEGYPVKVTEIKVEKETLSVTMVTLTTEERKQLQARLTAPLGEEPPPAIAATPVATK